MRDLKQSVLEHISKQIGENRLEKAFEAAQLNLQVLSDYPKELGNEINLVVSRYNQLQSETRLGLLSFDQQNRLRCQIIVALQSILGLTPTTNIKTVVEKSVPNITFKQIKDILKKHCNLDGFVNYADVLEELSELF